MKWLVNQIGLNFTDQDIREMIREADTDGSGEVDIREFFRLMQQTKVLSQSINSAHPSFYTSPMK